MKPSQDRDYWERHARTDPMWAVLSDPAKKGRKWNVREFMANGEREIALLWHTLEALDLVPDRGAALDFGCGPGRLTQALARRCARVTGMDISPSMVALARALNRYPSIAEYVCSDETDLRGLPSRAVDLIYSNIVLQHVEPQLSVEYLNEWFRLLKPGGVLVFQLPSHQEPLTEATIRPMPDDAYRAQIELTAPVPSMMGGAEALATVRVTNASRHEWRQRESGSIRVGNHWFDATGRSMVIQDDGRAVLPQVMRPGDSCVIVLPVTAPATPGCYHGEIDIVHEGVTWFRDRGSRTVRFDVQVNAPGAGAVANPSRAITEFLVPEYPGDLTGLPAEGLGIEADAEPFPMFGVPRAEVLAIIARHGGTLVHLEDGLRAGVEWVDHRYFVRAADA